MIVKDLIKELQEWPADTEVYVYSNDCINEIQSSNITDFTIEYQELKFFSYANAVWGEKKNVETKKALVIYAEL